MSTPKILVTGSNGLLGQKIVNLLIARETPFLAVSKGENRNPNCPETAYQSIDVTDEKAILDLFDSQFFEAVIHTAAMTNVDQCETEKAGCDALNVDSVRYLFEACQSQKIHFQLLSTDFVFDGKKGNYSEKDEPHPLSYYGASKVAAENILLNSEYTQWSIVRTIIVYGWTPGMSRNNLVLWAMDALPKQSPMRIVDDQFRSPTLADDLAWACVEIIKRKQSGIFHISGDETKSIYDWVCAIGNHFGWSTDHVERVSSSALSQAAQRPPRTGFNLDKAKKLLDYQPAKLEDTLDQIYWELKG